MKPKSFERIQAQVESYADQELDIDSEDIKLLLGYSDQLAQIKDFDNLPENLPIDVRGAVRRHKDEYVKFLKKETRNEIDFNELNIKQYNEQYRDPILELKHRVAENGKNLSEYLGSGENGDAYTLDIDDNTLVAKFNENLSGQNFQLKALMRAKDLPHVAQLVSYSYPDKVVVMELLEGINVDDFTVETLPTYSDDHITELIETVKALNSRGIMIDSKKSNFLYESNQGFNVLDYQLNESNYPLSEQVFELFDVVSFPSKDCPYEDGSIEKKEWLKEFYKTSLPKLIRFFEILKSNYPELVEDFEGVRGGWDSNTRDWVRVMIDADQIPVDDPELQKFVSKLESMGFL